jgi:hypothetical protein
MFNLLNLTAMEKPNDYRHFLSCNTSELMPLRDLDAAFFYQVRPGALSIMIEHRGDAVLAEFKTNPDDRDIRDTLRRFLLDSLSRPDPFTGDPEYVTSNLFTREEFYEIKSEALEIVKEHVRIARQTSSPLIRICTNYRLWPEPAGFNTTSWLANCPAHPNHRILISTGSNEWGCPYCKRKGGEAELLAWLRELGRKMPDDRIIH